MGKKKIDDDMKGVMRTLFVKGMLPCEEIGKRFGVSKQSVALALKNMGVQTVKKKYVTDCSQCGTPVAKSRSELRGHEHHFCSTVCYKLWMSREDVKDRIQRNHYLSTKFAGAGCIPANDGINMFFMDDDTYVFESREQLLEWKRTGLTYGLWSVMKGKKTRADYNSVKEKELA